MKIDIGAEVSAVTERTFNSIAPICNNITTCKYFKLFQRAKCNNL